MTAHFAALCELVQEINAKPEPGLEVTSRASPADEVQLAAIIESTSVAAALLLLGTGWEADGREVVKSAQSWIRQAALAPELRRDPWSLDAGVLLLAYICRLSGIDPVLPNWQDS